ncbi:MAG TPA: hypothetical protein VFF27_16240, partial [Bacteroidia bacterium]|nr:hypothetical protein [Bacteroidia bacterium]
SFAISKTIAVQKQFSENKVKMEQAANAPEMAAQLEKELIHMDAKIGNHHTKNPNVDEALLSLITDYCQSHHAVLREFPETTYAEDGELEVETNQFMIGGNFATLINLVYLLEQKYNLGKVIAVNYQLKKDFKTKELQLTARVFLQNIKKKSHEK